MASSGFYQLHLLRHGEGAVTRNAMWDYRRFHFFDRLEALVHPDRRRRRRSAGSGLQRHLPQRSFLAGDSGTPDSGSRKCRARSDRKPGLPRSLCVALLAMLSCKAS